MKKAKLAALAITLIGLFGTGNALAADTATLDVTAEVIGACQFDSDGALDFGPIDALNATDLLNVAATTNPTFTCTNGTGYTITDDAAANPLTGPDTIVYSLNYTAAGVATGALQTLAVTGDLMAADYTGKPVGSYAAQVTFSINP